uniref:Uncharacterized protein n=1 Tax=Arundo donax TaxID=35708 RepID=A0A0A9ACU9_ARUDO
MKEAIIKHLELKNSSGLEVVAVSRHTGTRTADGIDDPGMPDNVHMSLVSESSCRDIGSKADAGIQDISNEIAVSKFQGAEEKASNLRAELNELKESGKRMAHVVDVESTMNECATHESIFISGLNRGKQDGVTCLESKLQLECCSGNEGSKDGVDNEQKHLQMVGS